MRLSSQVTADLIRVASEIAHADGYLPMQFARRHWWGRKRRAYHWFLHDAQLGMTILEACERAELEPESETLQVRRHIGGPRK